MNKTISIYKKLAVILGVILLITVIRFGYKDIPLETLKEKYANPPSKFIPINGMDIHYRDEGIANDSLPIVLIHGTSASLHTCAKNLSFAPESTPTEREGAGSGDRDRDVQSPWSVVVPLGRFLPDGC